MRWLVERKGGEFEDVGADLCGVAYGCLMFTSADGVPVYMVAAGEWVTVVPEGDEL